MRQVKFELLRHGPSNNQLLSPLTEYLALCGNHSATTVRLPFEHNQFLHRLRALSRQLGEETRSFQVKDTARALAEVLCQVPGLVAELSRDRDMPDYSDTLPDRQQPDVAPRDRQSLTHLRLIISSSELALLPFELALAPPGFPGAGQSLLLQFQAPICLTREVRRVAENYLSWPNKPRILFVAAAPSDVPPVPAELHIGVLRELLQPWIGFAETDERRSELLKDHLHVLENASCQDIARVCAEGDFTHVHILAHGIQYQDGFDLRFGIAFHDPADPQGKADPVSGERLATALRPVRAAAGGSLARPVAVTLASCDSANPGTVQGVGGSVAHALHTSGIPMVVASQFPISVPASIPFVKILYKALLWGDDPRIALNDLRRRLFADFPKTHDWAGITAYMSLPPRFESELSDVQIEQTRRSMDAAMSYADHATATLMQPKSGAATPPSELTPEKKLELLGNARTKIEEERKRLERLADRTTSKARVLGILAATEKRCAEVYFSFSRADRPKAIQYGADWLRLLLQARKHYWDAFQSDRDNSWGVVQYLSLDLILRRLKSPDPDLRIENYEDYNQPEELWIMAHVSSMNDLRTKDDQRIRWALSNLIELYLIAPLVRVAPAAPVDHAGKARQRTQDLIDRVGPDAFEIYSTRRQLLRYDDWYSEIANLPEIAPVVGAVLALFPKPIIHA